MRSVFWLVFILLLISTSLYSKTIRVSKASYPVKVDGIMEEVCWDNADVARNFQMNFPYDTLNANSETEVRITYDEDNLYISAICFDRGGNYVVQSLKRDFDFYDNDAFGVYIDAFSDNTSGLSFAVSPYGVQRDAIIYEGGVSGDDDTWDGLWEAEVTRSRNCWVVEMAIPFKTLRFKTGIKDWRINFARIDHKNNERSSWSPVPRGYKLTRLAFAGLMKWETQPKATGSNIALIPYAASILDRDFEDTNENTSQFKPNAGLDAKVAITSSINLDVTLNPDFSQVDVDQQIINLSRFEPSFPERRLFFLENSDLFSQLGNSRVRPFFSRRVGLTDEDEPVSLIGGAKLSGKLNSKWRVGLMSVQTEEIGDENGHNYTLGVAEKKVLGSSALRFFLSNAQDVAEGDFISNGYNRMGGMELDFRTKDTKITGHSYFHYSTNQHELDKNISYGAKARYKDKHYNFFVGIDAIGQNFDASFGYVPHLAHEYDDSTFIIGYTQYRSNGSYRFYFNDSKIIDFIEPLYKANFFTGNNGDYQEHDYTLGTELSFKDQSSLLLKCKVNNPRLYQDNAFTLSGLDQPFAAGNYHQVNFSVEGISSRTKRIYGSFEFSYGDKYLGKLTQLELDLNYRTPSPWGSFGLNYTSKKLHSFPTEYGNAHFHLLGAKAEFSVNKNLFWTTFTQYNTQKENINVNSRLQWRFRPLSDLFVVYSSNYYSEEFDHKNWALVLKFNYWISL